MKKEVRSLAVTAVLSALCCMPAYAATQITTVTGDYYATNGCTVRSVAGYGGYGFNQAAASACANYASRYGAVRVTSVRQTSADKVHVYGYVSRGYGSDDFDCSFRSDGRVSDFDL